MWGIKVSMITSRIFHDTSVNSTITTIYLVVTSALPMDGCNIAIVGENDIVKTMSNSGLLSGYSGLIAAL